MFVSHLHRRLRLGEFLFQASLGKTVHEIPNLNRKFLGVVEHACHPMVQADIDQKQDPVSKITAANRTGDIVSWR
jgi:hypothetical protein